MADIQDINAATHNLHQLLDVVAEAVMNTPADSDGLVARAQALACIARDEAERLDAAVEKLVDAGLRDRNSEAKAIIALGEKYDVAREAWIKADMAADKLGDAALTEAAQNAEAVHDKYRDELFAFRPMTRAGFAAKSKVFLRIWDMAEGMDSRRIVQFLEAMGASEGA